MLTLCFSSLQCMAIGNVPNISENLAASTVKAEVMAESEHLHSTLKSPLEMEVVISSENMPLQPMATQWKKQHTRININKKLLWKFQISYNSLTLQKQKLCVQHLNFTLSCISSTHLLSSYPITQTYYLTPSPELHYEQAFLWLHFLFVVNIISHCRCCHRHHHHHHLHWFWYWILGCSVSKLSDNESNCTEINYYYYCTSR